MSEIKIVPARRTENVKYAIRDITILAGQVAKTGKEMLYLNIGDPNVYDWKTPKHIIDATYKAMLDNKNGYSPSSGIAAAVDAIEKDANAKGIDNVLDIFVTTGGSEAIELCLSSLLNPGDNFLMPTPGYPLYTAVESKIEATPNPYFLDEKNGWQPDIEDIKSKINSNTKAIVIINPNNPTGSVCKKETLLKLIDIALEHNLIIMADEIYDKLIFDNAEMISIASLNKDVSCITFAGLSKNYVVPGWRLGWGIVSGRRNIMADYVEAINKLLRARLSANHPEQYGLVAALTGDQSHIPAMNKELQRRRDTTIDIINTIDGIDLVKPQGAFYAYPSIDVDDDTRFCNELLKETGVVVVPGSGFGKKPKTNYFRYVILPPEEILVKGFKLISEFYDKYKNTPKY
ncbi:MAG: aminotransferase class I/II-fold pyridoxal phosphate-dependent enzyme [Ignavibacteria bacterium]|jgi:alanine-synthesizing transaminase|nr:aminotransferase class I/II-fold pyridoxal phosphate-dependent enzyme [Ignavibacteria bacterium]